jgi:hypothetical protein
MYSVIFRNDRDPLNCAVICKRCPTIAYARAMRRVSGDIVVHSDTHEVVKDFGWLWEWELLDKNSYAYRAIDKAR